MIHFFHQLRHNAYPLVDNTTVDLYVSPAWPGNGHELRYLPEALAPRPAVTLIATVRNEEENITGWLDSLLAQTRLPDEIVIVDGGSTDKTFDVLLAFAKRSPVPIKVWQEPGANIARGRNVAIERAAGPLIACTDAGCVIPPDWLATITGPFAVDATIEVVAGYYEAIQQSDLQRVMAAYFVAPPAQIEPQSFLPSARSLVFRKEVWQKVGGFPEWLTLTAEDTLFDLMLKKHTRHWAFVPEAVVRWQLKRTIPQLYRQVHAYGRGEGEAGIFPEKWWEHVHLWFGLSLTSLTGLLFLILALIFKTWLWLLAALLLALWLARRLWRITLRPTLRLDSGEVWPKNLWQRIQIFVLSVSVVGTITLGLVIGFIEGVRQRKSDPVQRG